MRLIDRDREQAELRLCFASAGRRVAIVTGVPGIGKSALLQAMGAELRADVRDIQVLSASGMPVGTGIAYGTLRQLFGALAASTPVGEAPFDGPGALLRRLVLGEPVVGDAAAVAYAVHWTVSSLARPSGLAIVLDDTQWLDPISGDVIAAVLSLAADESVVVAAGIRESPREARTPFVAALYDLADAVVSPRPLDAAAIGELLSADAAVAAEVREITGGVPFYVTELGAMIAAGEAPGTPLRAIESIMARLERLGPPALEVARAVCVLGPDATPGFVARLAASSSEHLDVVVRALTSEGVLAAGTQNGALSSAQPLVGDAVLAGLGFVALARLRERAAELLHDRGVPAPRVAAQLLLTEPAGVRWHAEVLLLAAESSIASGAESEAVALVERALLELPPLEKRAELIDLLGVALLRVGRAGDAARAWQSELPNLVDDGARVRRLMDIGDAWYADGDYEAAESAYGKSLELLGRLGFAPQSAQVLEHAARFATTRLTIRPLAEVIPAAVLSSVMSRPPGSHGREERRFLAVAALSAFALEDWGSEPEHLAELAYGGGTFAVEGFADDPTTYMLSGALYRAGRFDDAFELLSQAVDDARRRHRVASEITARSTRGSVSLIGGHLLTGLDDLEASVGLSLLGANPLLYHVSASVYLIRCSGLVGDLDRSARIAEQLGALELPASLRAVQLIGLGEQALKDGAPEQAARAAARSRELDSEGVFAWTFSWRGVAAAAALTLGDLQRAAELNLEERRLLVQRRVPLAAHLDSVLLTARLQADPEAHATLLDYLERLPERHRWQRAIVAERLGQLSLTAYPDDAHEQLLFALAVAQEQGMLPLERRARQLLRIMGREPAPSSLERRMRTLSPSELRVAARAATGLSNREIARELFITLKTVEFHLARTYRKLGVTSRRELGAAFAEAGEIAPPASA